MFRSGAHCSADLIMTPEEGCMEKRQRERVRKQKQLDKEHRRNQRATERRQRELEGGKDTGLEGIVPGPQPGQIIDRP
jgi:hypothetical protein